MIVVVLDPVGAHEPDDAARFEVDVDVVDDLDPPVGLRDVPGPQHLVWVTSRWPLKPGEGSGTSR
ncbi:hypothetical protein BRD56_11450 [Thermoplasmatales archaeon SW_10_69_26]|nr:MAG: hypothetical protein BRD56_11450 [Thermoplasmatales archaeon SW_10_69_26]